MSKIECKKFLRCTLRCHCSVDCEDYDPCDNVAVVHDGKHDTQKLIAEECDNIKEILLEKNRKYGDSAINPCRIFSKADPLEQINVRLDDKLSRIMSGQDDEDEDPELDIIGYLILKRIAKLKNLLDSE